MSQKTTVKRIDFVRKFMQANLTYEQACNIYACLIGVLEDAVVNGDKVKFGKIGCLFPVRKPPRDVVMGFVRVTGGKIVHSKRVFHLDERTGYRFNFYSGFVRKHQLR